MKKRGYNIDLLTDIIKKLANDEPLPARNLDHDLYGNFNGCRECHITPDWLLIYEKADQDLILYLTRRMHHTLFTVP